ncbi:hypothetical protein [Cobetia sp. QF-1]|uniref:hypothetical protein n=1 Tax=Cobetia sp. QF-1 TaxID=1969833 RepID=UPI000B548E33|nr:hypothetical protein [Cobetia sp. QF-1]
MNKIFENKVITHTVVVPDALTDASVATLQADYSLTAVEFEHIKHGRHFFYTLAHGLLLITIGYGINLGAKASSVVFGVDQKIYFGEWIAFSVGAFFTIAFFTLSFFVSSDHKKVMKDIKDHFKNSPKRKQLVRGISE